MAEELNGHATPDAVKDLFGEPVQLYQCDGCKQWFHPGDTYVTGDGVEYCYGDHTGNGCINKHLTNEQREIAGYREEL